MSKANANLRHEHTSMDAKDSIRVMTVDDHDIVRSGIRSLLLAFDDIELVGEAENGNEAISLCRELRPDVVMMNTVTP